MSNLVDKVAKLASDEFRKTVHSPDEFAKVAIATVLTEMIKAEVRIKTQNAISSAEWLKRFDQTMLRAFAAEHNIHIGEGKEGEKDGQ